MMFLTRAFIRKKYKVAQNEKRKKLPVFSYSKNLANFEAFHCHFIKHNLEYIQKHGAIFFENKLEKKNSQEAVGGAKLFWASVFSKVKGNLVHQTHEITSQLD